MSISLSGHEIRPTPLVTISQQSEFRDNGEVKTITKIVELKGKILAIDPVAVPPETEPTGDALTVDKTKLALLRNKIAILEDYVTHKIDDIYISTTLSGPHLDGKFKLKSKNFQINQASLICDYTISLEQIILDKIIPDETWSLDPADEYGRFVKINRTRSIQIKSTQNPNQEYQLAMNQLKPSTSIAEASTYLTIPSGGVYNKTTSYSVNTYKNSVDCTESWVISKNPYIIEQTTSTKETSDSIYKSASLQGTITGYESATSTKYDNAKTQFDSIKTWKMGDTYTIGSVSGKVRSISEGTNKIAGTITYSIDISEGIEEDEERTKSITWTDTPPLINFVSIPAIGKTEGPIIQKLTTKKNGVKTVNVEVIYKDGVYKEPTDVDKYTPSATEIFVEKDDITYDYKTGKITRSVVWNYN
jgi:hypothetical protein